MSDVSGGLVGAIEAGGTKFVCAIGRRAGGELLVRQQFPTGDDPERLMSEVVLWLSEQQRHLGRLAAVGVASFGPLDLCEGSKTWGCITTTPKRGWQRADLLGPLRRGFPGVRLALDTDVNGAALGEQRWGAARGLEDFLYVTVGTGIGGGGMARGQLLHGLMHPEMGHMLLPGAAGDDFAGVCPFHGRCWEGLCSGPAIAKRAGRAAEELSPDDEVWSLTIRSMAQAMMNLTCVLSPRRIVLGGSVRKAGRLGEEQFFRRLRADLGELLAGYIGVLSLSGGVLEEYLVPPQLGDDAGVCGALALGQDVLMC
ncbi:MAG: ROK family protein [Planctomycetaceae bacterium]|jgi:fructokinase